MGALVFMVQSLGGGLLHPRNRMEGGASGQMEVAGLATLSERKEMGVGVLLSGEPSTLNNPPPDSISSGW